MRSGDTPHRWQHWGEVTAAIGLAAQLASAAATVKAEARAPAEFRVCADANNLPFSNRAKQGFENRLAQMISAALDKQAVFVWQPQRRGFIRRALDSGECDALMGVPTKLDRVETTRPYYRSTYVFLYQADRRYALQSIKDPRLKNLRIGVQLIGNDGYNTPPAHALSEQGIVDNLVGYTVYGDYRLPNPPARIVEAVENGEVDLAAVWGPIAGYFAQRSPVPLTLTPITEVTEFNPLLFQFDISVGVRKDNHVLKSQIDAVLAQHRTQIIQLLRDYAVPLIEADEAHAGDDR
jgi:mxaJ protein